MKENFDNPMIIGYFDDKLNCLYSAIEAKETTLVKQMVVSKDPDFIKQQMIRVEMSYTGYKIEPVYISDIHYSGYQKAPIQSKDSQPKPYWALGWFKADYMRWLTLSHLDKKEAKRILGDGKKPSNGMYSRPRTSFIATVTLSELLAAHVCYAHSVDWACNERKTSIGDLLDLYMKEFDLRSKHSNNLRNMAGKTITSLNLSNIKKLNEDPNFTIGVDTFIKFK